MLSDISFEDLYEEGEVDTFSDKKEVILAFLGLCEKGVGAKQLQKLLFLSSIEGKKILPFKFKKHHYGPYSEDIKKTIKELKDEDIVKEEEEIVIDFPRRTTKLTEKGKKEADKEKIREISEILKKILGSYINLEDFYIDSGASLEKYCYENFYLKKDQNSDEWPIEIKNKIENVRCLLSDKEEEIVSMEDLEKNKKDIILMRYDYMENLLERLYASVEEENMDQVLVGAFIKILEQYVDEWGEIISLLKEDDGNTEKILKKIKSSNLLFKFLNKLCSQYNFFESVFPS